MISTIEAISSLDQAVPTPNHGLPDEVFYYISRTTPLINVDLLVRDPQRGVLLSWRDDPFCGAGWHVPGGVIRYKEKIETRIQQVACNELGAGSVVCDLIPQAVNEIIVDPKRDRAHFISMLYYCKVGVGYQIDNGKLAPNEPGYLMWHLHCPDDLLSWHEMYRPYIEHKKE